MQQFMEILRKSAFMNKTIIIAEAGVNHNGNIKLAKQLIDVASEAGADYVKFQTFKANKLVSESAKRAAYQIRNTGDADETQLEMLKKLELSHQGHLELIDYCKQKNIQFLSTAFDLESLSFLKSLNLGLGKVPSGEINNLPYLQAIAKAFPEIILSTGMASLEEVSSALDILLESGIVKSNITILHCNTEYPTPMADVNLLAMQTIKNELGVNIGYSDHTLGIEVPIAAVALGATVIEKHFTLNNTLPGPDHAASLEPHELKAMVRAIRNIELAMSGDGKKSPSQSEIKNKIVARKSIHLCRDVKAYEIITDDMLIMKRPGYGISPMEINQIVGKRAIKDLFEDQILNYDDFEQS